MTANSLCCFFRKPYHSKLEAFVNHMSKGPGASFESPLHSLPLYSSHQLCEMGELTQTGQYIDHSSTYSSTHSRVWWTRAAGPRVRRCGCGGESARVPEAAVSPPRYLIKHFFLKIYLLFLVALGLHCCVQAFSSCNKWGLLFIALHWLLISATFLMCGLSSCGAQA